MPYAWPPRLAALVRAGRDRDPAALSEVATATGLVDADDVTPEVLLALLDPLLDPLRQETFTFTRAWLRAQTARVSNPRSEVARTANSGSPSGTCSSNGSPRAPPGCPACSGPRAYPARGRDLATPIG